MITAPPLGRRDAIAARLDNGLPVESAGLAAEYGVSEDAIRRDLRALAAEGRCRRVYGGALPLAPIALPARLDVARARKAALARAAAATVRPGEFLFLDAGSTNHALAGLLPADLRLTVATNSPDIAAALLRRPGMTLILVGGEVDPVVGGAIDAAAVEFVRRMTVDRCFLGACSVSAGEGIGAEIFADAGFKRALVAASRLVVVPATTEKLGAAAPHRVADLAAIDLLVVERDAPEERLAALGAAGIDIAPAGAPE